MITVQEAKYLIQANAITLSTEEVDLSNCVGRFLSKDLFSPENLPSFIQSSMDGYAINFEGFKKHQRLKIVGEVTAGISLDFELKPDEAARIFTGAALPKGTDTIVMQEKVSADNGLIEIKDEQIKLNQHVRFVGSDIKKEELLLPAKTQLTASAIALLASAGMQTVSVFQEPNITIIITGNEMQNAGQVLEHGKIHESNSYFLKAALKQLGLQKTEFIFVEDNLLKLSSVIATALQKSDLIILTGGVSVGDYDFVTKAAANCDIETIFHKVKQKPGKPLFFGRKNNTLVFGLPGNPSSALTCYYVYVQQALHHMNVCKPVIQINNFLKSPVSKPTGLTHFLKGFFDGKSVQVLHAQESYKLSSFAIANCLIELPEEVSHLNEADAVNIYLLT